MFTIEDLGVRTAQRTETKPNFKRQHAVIWSQRVEKPHRTSSTSNACQIRVAAVIMLFDFHLVHRLSGVMTFLRFEYKSFTKINSSYAVLQYLAPLLVVRQAVLMHRVIGEITESIILVPRRARASQQQLCNLCSIVFYIYNINPYLYLIVSQCSNCCQLCSTRMTCLLRLLYLNERLIY